jgi:alkanesulfonate monooxygenase SsuD/methylene tetrahydromethanopterin reductase-like flavin-dependent oxidoreductase (luciferase family)
VTIAILGSALPLREHPLTIAEEHAMIDVISGGRLISGFVRGIGAEYYSFGVNPTESHDRYHEAHDLIVQAWSRPGPFAFEGKYYHFEYVNVWPRPFQQPHPPVWVPSQGSQETIDFASHPDRKYTYLQTFSSIEQVAKHLGLYRAKAREYGYEAKDSQLGWAVPVYVGKTDEQALAEARDHIEAFRNKFIRMKLEMLLPPGYLSMRSMKGVMGAKAQIDKRFTAEMLMEAGMFICGSPSTVRSQLLEHHKRIGFGALLPMLQFGTLPHELTVQNLELFAREVMPALKEAGARAEQKAG